MNIVSKSGWFSDDYLFYLVMERRIFCLFSYCFLVCYGFEMYFSRFIITGVISRVENAAILGVVITCFKGS